jgi:hypothetical protein
MASLRSLAISLLRLDGHINIAAANRHHAPRPTAHAKAASDRMNDFAGSLIGVWIGLTMRKSQIRHFALL